jgi:hypothetical protein
MFRHLTATVLCAVIGAGQTPRSSPTPPAPATSAGPPALAGFNDAIQALITKVAQSVVQIVVSGYGPEEKEGRRGNEVTIGHQRPLVRGLWWNRRGMF